VSNIEVREFRQLAQLDWQPFELIVVDLSTLGSDQSTQIRFRTPSALSCVSWPISAGSDVSWLSAT
jgi:hypothetical protein